MSGESVGDKMERLNDSLSGLLMKDDASERARGGDYVYRGGSLDGFNSSEFRTGEIQGRTLEIYRGAMEGDEPPEDVERGTPIDDLPWFAPPGEDRPYLKEEQGVTGGITDSIGTAINFGSGVPMVLYINERKISCTPVRYRYDFFDHYEGALPWVAGDAFVGEIRLMEEGLYALLGQRPSGPVVQSWGEDGIQRSVSSFSEERECIVPTDSIDLQKTVDAVASFYSSPKSIPRALGGLGTGDTGQDPRDAAVELHEQVLRQAKTELTNYWVVALNTNLMEHMEYVKPEWVEFAYNGEEFYEGDEVPGYLLAA